MALDIGLPLELLRQPLRSQLSETYSDPRSLVLDAVNRQGRPIEVRVTLTSLHDHGSPGRAAVIAMEARVDGEE
jgi:pyridoxine/pyridoxamine 5'-phosphate oxidase